MLIELEPSGVAIRGFRGSKSVGLPILQSIANFARQTGILRADECTSNPLVVISGLSILVTMFKFDGLVESVSLKGSSAIEGHGLFSTDAGMESEGAGTPSESTLG